MRATTKRMRQLVILFTLLSGLLLVLSGCGATGDTSTDDDEDGDTNDGDISDGDYTDGDYTDGDGGLTIYDIQNEMSSNHPFPGSNVTLNGVVATSTKLVVSAGSNLRGFFIAEPQGGEYSGIMVVMKGDIDFDPIVGDLLTINGVYVEFCGVGETPYEYCSSQIELTSLPEVTGTGTAPAPTPIANPADIATGGTLMDHYDGSLVQVSSVEVTNPDIGYGEFEITGGLSVDDLIYAHTAFLGQKFKKLTGFLYVAYGTAKMLPRNAADLEEDGGDVVDGLKIADIQNPNSPNHPSYGPVSVDNVVVTSLPFVVSSNSGLMGIFVSDQGGGPWSGIMVVWKSTESSASDGYDPPEMTPGMVLNLTGNYVDFCGTGDTPDENCSTQIEVKSTQDGAKMEDTGSTAAVPAATVVNPEDIKTGGALAEQWQDSLVRVLDVVVTNNDRGYGEFEVTDGLIVDDTIFRYEMPDVGTAYDQLTGFLMTAFNDFKLEPRDANDMGGDITDGDVTDGDVTDGDVTDGDITDGDVTDGDIPGLTIFDIQNSASPEHPAEGPVELDRIVVTSAPFLVATSGLQGIFVADQGGGPYSGCLLTWKPTAIDAENGYDPPAMTPGMVINVAGSYEEFCGTAEPYYTNCSTQIALTPFSGSTGSVTDTGATTTVPAATLVNPADVRTGGSQAEVWQHSLIVIENVTVTDDQNGFGMFEVTGGLLIDDQIYRYEPIPEVGTEYSSITGFHYTSYDDHKLIPRNAADMVEGSATDGDVTDGDITDGDVHTDIVINELVYNGPGTDGPNIFIELSGPSGASLDGYQLVGINGFDDSNYVTIPLTGQTIPVNGYFVITHANAEGDVLANSDYVDNGVDLQNGPDSLVLKYNDDIIDTVGYGDGASRFETAPAPTVFGENSLARVPDSEDTNDNSADFIICDVPSPGRPNTTCTTTTDGDVTDGDVIDGDVVINEVLYDMASADTGEDLFIELKGTPGMSLSDYSISGIDGGTGNSYANISLFGQSIPGDGYFVVVHANAAGATASAGDYISNSVDFQNGPDAIALKKIDEVIDLVGYGASTVFEGAAGPDVSSGASLARNPDGVDTNDNSVDFAQCPSPTPGASNSSCF